jgi:hypothetical protein
VGRRRENCRLVLGWATAAIGLLRVRREKTIEKERRVPGRLDVRVLF